ncbi:MAG: hypothetical protein U0031_00035 [Thermomicrobiales bacterium]
MAGIDGEQGALTPLSSPAFWHDLVWSRPAAAVAFGWGLAEATAFFIVPDVWLGLITLFDRRGGARAVAWSVAGALLGGAIMYGAGAAFSPPATARFLDAIPAISPAMIDRVEQEMRAQGLASMLLGPLRGTPYKIYARTAGVQRQSLPAMLLWTIPARSARFLLIAALAAAYGAAMRRCTSHPAWLLGPYFLTWIVFYWFYFRTYGS